MHGTLALFFLCDIALIAIAWHWLAAGLRGSRRGDEPHCPACAYLLIGIRSERCPECGTPISAANIVNGQRTRRKGLAFSGGTLLFFGVVYLGLLTVIAASGPAIGGGHPRPQITAAATDVSNMKVALDMFKADVGRYPTAAEGLNVLVNRPAGVAGWQHPYLDKLPTDPWGEPYVYRCPGSKGKTFDLLSCGPDGVAGTADDIK